MLKSRYKIGSIILLATLIVASTARADPPGLFSSLTFEGRFGIPEGGNV